jgi:hypothetical protein
MKNILLALALCFASSLAAKTFVVNSTNETGSGTLSQAVQDANWWRGLDTIVFDLPGSGPFFLGTNPDNFELTDPVLIDGFSQSGNLVVNISLYSPKSFTIRSSHVSIRGFRFNATQAMSWIFIDPISTTPLTDILISNNRFDLLANGIGVEVDFGGFDPRYIERLTISQNYFKGYGRFEAIYLDESSVITSQGISQLAITQNTFKDCKGLDWDVSGDNEEILISDNTFDESDGIELYVYRGKAEDVLITRNTIIGGSRAINLTTSIAAELKKVEISHNQMEQCNTGNCAGIYIRTSGSRDNICNISSLQIKENVIKDRWDGITLRQSGTSSVGAFIDTMVIVDNEISNCKGNGIELDFGATGNSKLTLDSLLISRNVISSCEYSGIDVGASPLSFSSFEIRKIVITDNEIRYNKDGVDIHMSGRCSGPESHFNFGSSVVRGNLIHDNLQHGIVYENRGGISPQAPNYHGIVFRQNSIYNNGSLGIWSRDYYFQNAQFSMFPTPKLLSITENGGVYDVSGSLFGAQPQTAYRLEFYASTLPDSSGNGEGERYLNNYNLTTDANGNAFFTFQTTEDIGFEYISATSTQINKGNTSEFGNAISLYSPGVGIEEMEDIAIELFPNPAHDLLCIKWREVQQFSELSICSLSGKTLFTQSINRQNNRLEVPIEGLPTGTYVLILKDEKGRLHSINWVKLGE